MKFSIRLINFCFILWLLLILFFVLFLPYGDDPVCLLLLDITEA
jgi:hypothetical protein